MPSFGDLFTDLRGEDRTMRVSYHPDRGALVVSLWSGTVCRGSFRMAAGDVERLLSVLTEIQLSATSVTPAGPPTGGATTAGPGAAGAAVAEAPAGTEPAVDQTGDISGTAHRGSLPILPVPRVA
ncbi:hypothetical protein GA0070624_4132 [Micromonospora rhizosphaerae]|uniref:Uncharacterized protein n=1 Tax=Micromonospora rhizosphaerae TaxID=568872 RepID=A0A1C6SN80_9ACTN|nr:hypothetical protein [Micromonospora rhizosphaerae]SCL30729.1 hypothetical protein GA0070624_4132 [Micromonospora rhizosphaerae]